MTSNLNPAWLAWGCQLHGPPPNQRPPPPPTSAPSAPSASSAPSAPLRAWRLSALSALCMAQHALGRQKLQRLFDVPFGQVSCYAVARKGMSNSLQVSITPGGGGAQVCVQVWGGGGQDRRQPCNLEPLELCGLREGWQNSNSKIARCPRPPPPLGGNRVYLEAGTRALL